MKKLMQMLLSCFVLLVFVAGWIIVPNKAYAQNSIRVTVDGTALSFDVPPIIENELTLVPMRAIFESLGATVDWNASTRTIVAQKSDRMIQLTVGSSTANVNGNRVNLDVPAEIINDRTLVPVRFISEALGAQVDWDVDTQTVVITTGAESSWKQIYIDLINMSDIYQNYNGFALIYLNDDDIPELIIAPPGRAGYTIYTVTDGRLESMYVGFIRLYIERGNLLFANYVTSGGTAEGVYSIRNGRFTAVFDGLQERHQTLAGCPALPNREQIITYTFYLNGIEVSESEYAERLSLAFDESMAIGVRYETADEIIRRISGL